MQFEDGRYIVVLREPSATQYAGDRARYEATRARGGEQFNAGTDAARAYTGYLERTHRQIADQVGTEVAADYTVALNGFAAELTGRQAGALAGDRRVALVTPDTTLKLDTWASPDFLGLSGKNGVWARHGGVKQAGAGTVVGIIDTGIWPESRSFAGARLNSTPKGKWDIRRWGQRTFMDKADGTRFQGRCMLGEEWKASDCNTKVIGARYYADIYEEFWAANGRPEGEYLSARDGNGHGSHTAGTAAGNFGVRARVEGRDFGRVSGMAPAARIAAYKVCVEAENPDDSGCPTSASLAAIDDAVADGVDVINYSISGAQETVVDPVEIAFQGANEGGVFVATSAGNSGPDPETVAHASPWLTTVAASTHVTFENTVVLGDGRKFVGASISDTPLPQTPLIDSGDAALEGAAAEEAALCYPDTLDPELVAGKIVVCTRGVIDRVAKSAEVERAAGVGMILANATEGSLDADFHSVPTVHVDEKAAAKIWAYLEATQNPTAAFKLGNRTNKVTPVPQAAGFSSRGPSLANDADILKPDISAPGVSVLAAVAPPTNSGRNFDLYSGTSMAAPHVAGLAAFMISERPNWSPMQVKSAMMTTAKPLFDENGKVSTDAFAQGAGNVNPRRFFDPGLFITPTNRDLLGFLSGQGFDTGVPAVAARDVNQPSIALGQAVHTERFRRQFLATKAGVWKISSNVPGFEVRTSKKRLVSERPGDIESVKFWFTRTTAELATFSSGFIKLTGPTKVKIPVVLRPVSVKAPANVEGTGTEGSVPVPVTAGFTGELAVAEYGLAQAETTEDAVEAGAQHYYCVETSETTKALRVDLDSVRDDADLDLYGYVMETDCDSAAIDYLAISATGAADESFTVADPGAGSFVIEVDGYAAAPGESTIGYVLDIYDVNADTNLGDFRADPNPVPVTAGEPTTFDAVWSGLEPGARYLGVLEYEGALSPTYVAVDTTDPPP